MGHSGTTVRSPRHRCEPKISEPELETRPKNKLQYILNVRVLQPKSLDLAPVQSTLRTVRTLRLLG